MKKLLLSLFTMLLVASSVFGFTGSADAAKPESDSFKEEVGGIFVEIPYKKSAVTVEQVASVNENVDQINVYDKKTNELITEIVVEEETQTDRLMSARAAVAAAGTYSFLTVSQSTGSSYGKAYLKARLYVYSGGSFRQINEVTDTWWEQGSGMTYFESQNSTARSSTGKFPTTKIQVSGAATLTAEISSSYEAGFEAAGFSISGGSGGTYYARKNISLGYAYSVY